MDATNHEEQRRLELAVEAALEAGRHTLRYFRQDDLVVDRKTDDSPVTIADREAEALLRRRIEAAFPDDAILGEEFPDVEGKSPFRWILDPIDGTKSFIHGVPLYSTLVAVEREGEPRIGVLVIPPLEEYAYARIGHGAWYVRGSAPKRPAKVSQCATLKESLFLTSEVENFEKVGRTGLYLRLQEQCRLSRSWGDGYGYLMLATGRAEVMVDPIMASWDAGPLLPIMQEAGGTFTDWEGNASIHSGNGFATNGLVFDQVLEILRQ